MFNLSSTLKVNINEAFDLSVYEPKEIPQDPFTKRAGSTTVTRSPWHLDIIEKYTQPHTCLKVGIYTYALLLVINKHMLELFSGI